MDLEILVYDGFDELDAIGPYEVLRNGEKAGADLSTRLVTLESREAVTASHGLRVGVDGTLGSPDVLVVPGGGWSDRAETGAWGEYDRGDVPDAVGRLHDGGATVATVCTGGMLAAGAGLFDGRPAVTHASAIEDLRESGAEVVDARVVDDGDLLSAGGVTAGLDLAFHFLAREFGTDVRDQVATQMEYAPSTDVHRSERAI